MKVVAFVFLFLTLFNPISTNITVLFNISLFLYVKNRVFVKDIKDLIYPIILLILCVLSMSRYGSLNLTMLGIYGRMLVSFMVIPYIVAYFAKSKIDVVEILLYCLLLHCCVVVVQLFFPELEWINQAFFRYERDMDTLEDLNSRRLGLAGSFDVSGYFAAACSIISYISYVSSGKTKYLATFIISLISIIFTSRTGMSMALIGVGLSYFFYGRKHNSRIGGYLVLAFVLLFGYMVIYQVVMGNFSSFDLMSNYGENTTYYLFQTHLLPLYAINTNQLFWGVGTLISNASRIYGHSDIGYVKQIFEVGLVGVIVMVVFCLHACYKTYKSVLSTRVHTIMILVLNILILIFNYKNEFLWQVGAFDMFLIVYYFQNSKHLYK